MRKAAILCLLICVAGWAGPKRRLWQNATVIKIAHSVNEAEEQEYTPSPAIGVATAGVTTRRTKIWTYAVKTDQRLYLGQAEKRPIAGVREGDRIRIAVQHDALYVLTPGAKEHRLELLKTE